jgi:hypothetical protein
MPSAVVNPDSIRFPRTCPHCGRKAEGTYAVAAMRGLDVFFGGYSVPLLLDVPVCREAFDRRRTAALAALIVVLAAIAAGAVAAVVLAWKGLWLAALVAAAIAAALAAGGRTGWDAALLDRFVLGMYARSLSSTRLRVHVTREKYFPEWAGMNRLC